MTTTIVEDRAPAALARPAPAGRGYGPLPALLLVLTAVTGVVDAVSILSLGRVFVANMTGNVVFAGFAVTGAPGFSLSASLFALAGFLAGALIGGCLTVLTMTLTGLAADFRAVFCAGTTARPKARATVARRLIVIGTMLAGAVTGGWLVLHVSPLSALAVAVALLATVAIGAAAGARRPAAWRVAAA